MAQMLWGRRTPAIQPTAQPATQAATSPAQAADQPTAQPASQAATSFSQAATQPVNPYSFSSPYAAVQGIPAGVTQAGYNQRIAQGQREAAGAMRPMARGGFSALSPALQRMGVSKAAGAMGEAMGAAEAQRVGDNALNAAIGLRDQAGQFANNLGQASAVSMYDSLNQKYSDWAGQQLLNAILGRARGIQQQEQDALGDRTFWAANQLRTQNLGRTQALSGLDLANSIMGML